MTITDAAAGKTVRTLSGDRGLHRVQWDLETDAAKAQAARRASDRAAIDRLSRSQSVNAGAGWCRRPPRPRSRSARRG